MAVTRQRMAATALRILLAIVFIVSAGAKFLSIDDFELYIFSYGFFSLNLSYLIARICIGIELLTGLFLALGWWRRWTWLATMALLILFSLFLCYAALAGRTDSCQCFGRMADMSPVQSLLKNALLILIALIYGRRERSESSESSERSEGSKDVKKKWVSGVFVLGVFAAVFCLSVPDNWMFRANESRYSQEAYRQAIADGGALAGDDLSTGNHLVAFVTPGCPYCRRCREKLTSIAKRNQLDTSRFHYYEPSDLPEGLFLDITYGQRPLVLLTADGQCVATYHYRNINEKQIKKHFNQ